MRSDEQVKELSGEFPELSGPNVVWQKELYAHFGLLFSSFSILEAGLQNIYIYYALTERGRSDPVRSKGEWVELAEELERRAVGCTLGALLKALTSCVAISEFRADLMAINRKRNYFAHHFFRQENYQMTVDGNVISLIYRINALRREIQTADSQCDEALDRIVRSYAASWWGSLDFDVEVRKLKHLEEERARTNATFGWEQY